MNQILKTKFSTPPSALRVAILSANWHREIVHRLRDFATSELISANAPPDQIHQVELPGAFEIPLRAKQLAKSGEYDAIIGCAFVVDGGIYRHEFVAQAVVEGLMQVQLATDVPIFSAILTPHHFNGGEEHVHFFKQHFEEKGREVARALLSTVCAQV